MFDAIDKVRSQNVDKETQKNGYWQPGGEKQVHSYVLEDQYQLTNFNTISSVHNSSIARFTFGVPPIHL